MEDEIVACLEDIVAENSSTPDKLSRELQNMLNVYPKDSIVKVLEYQMVFGDPKLSGILKKFFEGSTEPLDNAYIKSLDFCECEVCKMIKDVEKLTAAEDIFKSTMIEPIFLTDSANYKHELIDNFKYCKTLLSGDEIGNSLSIDEICSPTVISLIGKINNEHIDEDDTTKELLEKANKAFNFCESNLAKVLCQPRDFNLAQKIRTQKGVSYLSRLLNDKAVRANLKNSKFQKPRNMSCDKTELEKLKAKGLKKGDFKEQEKVDTAKILQENAKQTKDTGIPQRGKTVTYVNTNRGVKEIPTGDTAQKPGGSSAPRSQV